MQIVTDIRRSDLVRLNLYFLFRSRANWLMAVIVALASFAYAVYTAVETTRNAPVYIALYAIGAVLLGIGSMLFEFIAVIPVVLMSATGKSGVLGRHVYTIGPDGLHESTDVNEGLHKWSGVHAVGRSADLIVVRINGYLFHVFPRRSFGSEQEFESCWEMIRRCFNHARRQAG